ncbi:MAG: response regulator [Candidatus Thiodiazotropha sp.]
MRILLAEDDQQLGEGLSFGLKELGHRVDWVQDGASALQAINSESLDVLILDLGLPDVDGMTVLKQLRKQKSDLPVLVLTARDTLESRIEGLDLGADDYVIKPFDLLEVNARLRAISRRREGRSAPLIEHGDLILNPASREVSKAGQPVTLSSYEYAVLETLITNSGRILSRQFLEESLYGWDEGVESNALEVYIHHLRKKLGKSLIKTVRGVGYSIKRSEA